MRAEFSAVRGEMRTEFAAVRGEMAEQIGGLATIYYGLAATNQRNPTTPPHPAGAILPS
jgi:hypothetical protein